MQERLYHAQLAPFRKRLRRSLDCETYHSLLAIPSLLRSNTANSVSKNYERSDFCFSPSSLVFTVFGRRSVGLENLEANVD